MGQESSASKLVPCKVSNRSCYLQSMPRRKKRGRGTFWGEEPSKLIPENWIGLEKSKCQRCCQVLLKLFPESHHASKTIQSNKNKTWVVSWKSWRTDDPYRRVKHGLTTKRQNQAELLCRWFIRTWQRGPQDWHLSDDLTTPKIWPWTPLCLNSGFCKITLFWILPDISR